MLIFSSTESVLMSLNENNNARSKKYAIALFGNKSITNDLALIKSFVNLITRSVLKLKNALLVHSGIILVIVYFNFKGHF